MSELNGAQWAVLRILRDWGHPIPHGDLRKHKIVVATMRVLERHELVTYIAHTNAWLLSPSGAAKVNDFDQKVRVL